VGQDKDRLISEAKLHMPVSQTKNLFMASHWQADVQALPCIQSFSARSDCLEEKCRKRECLPLPPPFCGILLLRTMSYGMEHPFGRFRSALMIMFASNFVRTLSLLTGRQSGGEKKKYQKMPNPKPLHAVQALLGNIQNTDALSTLF